MPMPPILTMRCPTDLQDWIERHGLADPYSCIEFLKSQGFVLTPTWYWQRSNAPTSQETKVIQYLSYVWALNGWTNA